MENDILNILKALPTTGFTSDILTKEQEKKEFYQLLHSINYSLTSKGISFPISNTSEILSLSFSDIFEISEKFTPLCLLAQDSYKISNLLEYQQIEFFSKTVNSFEIFYTSIIEDVKKNTYKSLRLMLSSFFNVNYNIIDQNTMINNYLNLKDFESLINKKINYNTDIRTILLINENTDFYHSSFFEEIKHEFLLAKTELSSILNTYKDNIMPVDKIKTNVLEYEFLTREAFEKFCSNIGITCDNLKSYYQTIITPNTQLGKEYELADNESLMFMISTKEIPSFDLDLGEQVSSKSSLVYEVTEKQHFFKETIDIYSKINETQVVLEIPIFISYQKIALIKAYSNKSIKIKD